MEIHDASPLMEESASSHPENTNTKSLLAKNNLISLIRGRCNSPTHFPYEQFRSWNSYRERRHIFLENAVKSWAERRLYKKECTLSRGPRLYLVTWDYKRLLLRVDEKPKVLYGSSRQENRLLDTNGVTKRLYQNRNNNREGSLSCTESKFLWPSSFRYLPVFCFRNFKAELLFSRYFRRSVSV